MDNNSEVFMPTLERLSQLVHKQYGCHIKFLDFKAIRGPIYRPVFMNLCKGELAELEGKLLLPIVMDQQLTGAAEILLEQELSDKDIHRLEHTVRMILQSSFENMSRLDTLEVLEQQMQNIQETEEIGLEDKAKVVSLDDHRKALAFAADQKEEEDFGFLETMSFPFLIEAQTTDDAFKMALEIHQMSGRRLFLPLEDLHEDTFKDAASFRELGAATLYTASIEKLSPKVQNTIVEYYQGERQADDPQIIVGTVKSYMDLKKSQDILPDLINRLAVGYLYMRQSFTDYKADNLMDFFIDSLSGRIYGDSEGRDQ